MDLAKLIERAKGICLSPKAEWPKIAAETTDVKSLYVGYVVILAAIPALAKFVSTARFSVTLAIGVAVFTYVLSLVAIYLFSLIISALAPTFDGTPSSIQALKVAVYSATPGWLAGIFNVIPWIGWLLSLGGAAYGVYVLYEGLNPLMRNPVEKSVGYAVLVVVCWILLATVISMLPAAILLGGVAMTGASLFRM